MIDALRAMDPVLQALLAGGFTWAVTALGAALVLVTRRMSDALLDAMLGFAAGVMIAASFWSLLVPAIDMAAAAGGVRWLPALVGFLAGGVFLRVADNFLPHLHPRLRMEQAEGVHTAWRRATLLVLAITLHNIPEGLAVGSRSPPPRSSSTWLAAPRWAERSRSRSASDFRTSPKGWRSRCRSGAKGCDR